MSKSQAKRIRVQKGLPMADPTVEEVREALKLHTPDQHSSRKPIYEAARLWVDDQDKLHIENGADR